MLWTHEVDWGQTIRGGGDCGKLSAQTLLKVTVMAGLQSFIPRREHWPCMARSAEFTQSNRIAAFICEMSHF